MKYIIPAAIAIGVGLVILLSYLLPLPVLLPVRLVLTDWAAILAGLAVLVGILNLLLVHTRRIQAGDRGAIYSLLTILSVLITLGIGVYESFDTDTPALYQESSMTYMLYQGILVASLATLSSLVLFFLVVAAVRMLRSKPNAWSLLFLAVVVIILVGWIPLTYFAPLVNFRQWIITVPATAGARGILLGVALGTVVIGLRVLTGTERPYRD